MTDENKPLAAVYEDKAWGKTACVVQQTNFTVHHLIVVPNSYCSRHLHEHRYNGFFVTDGECIVREFPEGEPERDTLLKAGDYYEVPPGMQHKFISKTGCRMMEYYFTPDVREEDIIRFSLGGLGPG